MHFIIALVLQATAPDAAVIAQTNPAEAAQPVQATAPLQSLEPDMVCRWEVPAGQRIRRRVCREVADIEAQADASADAAREMAYVRGGSYIDDEMAAGGMRP